MLSLLFFTLALFDAVDGTCETIYNSREAETGFNTWFSHGNFQYSVDGAGISKDCHQSFLESEKGYLYSPVIDIHPKSDINISVEFNISPCKDLTVDSDADKLSICTPLLRLYYVQLDDFDHLFQENSSQSVFEPIKVDGINPKAIFIDVDTLSDKHEDIGDQISYTTRDIIVPSINGKIQFRMVDDGTCFTLRNFWVHREFCPPFTTEMQYFPKTYANSERLTHVTGKCVTNSKSRLGTNVSTIMCDRRGEWVNEKDASPTCICSAGFEPDKVTSECVPCRSGFYKAQEGNWLCLKCPRNSHSDQDAAEFCECNSGFLRNISFAKYDSSCTKPVTKTVQHVKALPFDSFAKLEWDRVHSDDPDEPVVYLIKCFFKSQPTNFIASTTIINATSAVLSGFQASEWYTCSIGATNRVTSVVRTSEINFFTRASILPQQAETKQLGVEDHWFLHWKQPDELSSIEETVEQFNNNSTQYEIFGYLIVAEERRNRLPPEGAIVSNTTANLALLFPKFKNRFENVTFQIFVVHEVDDVLVNGTRGLTVMTHPLDPGGVGDNEGVYRYLPSSMSAAGVLIGCVLIALLLLMTCLLCVCIQFRRHSKKSNKPNKYIIDESRLGSTNGHTAFVPPMTGARYPSNHESMYFKPPFLGYPTGGINEQYPYMMPGGEENDMENNYDDLDQFQRETGAPRDFIQNNISKSQLSSKVQIGKGRFSVVFRARYTYQERQGGPLGSIVVAVKEPTAAYASDFRREIEIMAQIQHPNIVRLIGIVQPMNSSELQQIVMEYMDYGSLEQFMQRSNQQPQRPLNTTNFLSILLDVAKAMNYLHQNNYVHRDLAARNVLVGRLRSTTSSIYQLSSADFICKLSDFGLCRSVDNSGDLSYDFLNSANPLVPIRWLAPEVAEHKLATFAGDVWSFAIVTWEVFSYGQRPYWRWDSSNIMSAVKDGYRLPVPPECPLAIYEEILAACWQQDATQRPGFMDIVVRLEQFLVDPELQEMLTVFLKPSNFNPFHAEAKELVLNSENSVERWLKLLKMEQHWPRFQERDLVQLTQLTKMTYMQLKQDLGIQLVGNRRKIIQSIEVIRELQSDQQNQSVATATGETNGNGSVSGVPVPTATNGEGTRSVALVDQSLSSWCSTPPPPVESARTPPSSDTNGNALKESRSCETEI